MFLLVKAALSTGELLLGALGILCAHDLGSKAIDKMDDVGGSLDYKNGKASVYARRNRRDDEDD